MAFTYDVITPVEDANGVGLLYIVSGGWRSGWFSAEQGVSKSMRTKGRFGTLIDSGFTMFFVRHGSSPYFTVPEIIDDCRRAVRHIRMNATDYDIDPDRIGVFGASAGGHLSLLLATTGADGNPDADDPVDRVSSHVQAAVAYFPPVDLRGLVGPNEDYPSLNFDPDLADDMSPIVHVTPDDPPMLLIHGDKDELVPLSHSERMHAALEGANIPTNLIIIEDAAHGFDGKQARQAAAAQDEWFVEQLVGAGMKASAN